MENEIEVNKIARKLGNLLIDNGIKFMRSAFHIEPKLFEYSEFRNMVLAKFPNTTISLMDKKYYAITFWQWKQLIDEDWTHLKKWIIDKYDCDNFAYSFSSYASQVFEINTGGVVYGIVYDKNTGKQIDYHCWNLIITKEADNTVNFYFYEPINNLYSEYLGGDIIIGNWKYKCLSFIFF